MPFYLLATVVSLGCLMPMTSAWTAVPPAPPASAHAPVLPHAPAAAPSDNPAGEAARHARRTACLKEAKAKKLVGTGKNEYIKGCVG